MTKRAILGVDKTEAETLALCLSWGTFNLGRAVGGPKFGLDFTQYYVASRLALEGKAGQIYGNDSTFRAQASAYGAVTQTGESMTNAYPPFATFSLLPIALLPFRPALFLFTILSLFASAAGVWIFFANQDKTDQRALTLVGLLGAFSFFPLYYSLYMGQVNALLFLSMAFALYGAKRNRPWIAGFFIALGALIKIFPVLLIVFFAVKRKPRVVLAAVGFLIVLTAVSLTVLDPHLYHTYLTGVLLRQTEGGAFYRNQGLSGFLTRLLTPNAYVHPIADCSGLARYLGLGGGVLVLVLALVLVAQKNSGNTDNDLEFGLFWVAILIALPKSWEHYGVMLLFAYLAILRLALSRKVAPTGPFFLAFLSFCVWAFLLTAGTDYEQLPRTVWMQPVISAKFLSTVLLFAACVWLLRSISRFGCPPPLEVDLARVRTDAAGADSPT